MTVYLDLVMGLNFLVDFLLLMGTDRLCGYPVRLGRVAAAAALGGLYGGACMLPELAFLGNTLWRIVSLALMAVIAFGWNTGALRRGVLFVFLSMALGGIAMGMGSRGAVSLIAAAAGVCLMCVIGFRGKITGRQYVTVTLTYGGRRRSLTALRDTGNTLKDPITGESVLVVGSDVAQELLGLTQADLCSPIATVEKRLIPGLRLIPYRAVGQSAGMLLALRVEEVIIGKQKAGTLVAFAPQELGKSEGYQALAGGVI